jgi:hypothetical protein
MSGKKNHILTVTVLLLTLSVELFAQEVSDSPDKEYQVKAAFLYNFIKFVDWPTGKFSDVNEPIVVGIIGKDPFGNVFEALKDKKIKNKTVVIQRFKGFEELKRSSQQDQAAIEEQVQKLRKCHLLFTCSSEANSKNQIINSVKDYNVLTVGEADDFIDAGGIINFMVEEKKVRFEVNLDACDKEKLKISSQLLKLAKRVIKQK